MKLSTLTTIGSLVALSGLVTISDAAATNINTFAACRAAVGSQSSDISATADGTMNGAAAARIVTCTVPRAPLAAGATIARVFVDGKNQAGVTTSCTLTSFNFTGSVLGSVGFSSNAATYDQALDLPAAQAPTFAYFSLICQLPGNNNAILMGVTSVQ